MIDVKNLPFTDENTIPQLGFGVWKAEDETAADVVRQAIEAGYRHIDTAAIYGNEAGVGRGIKESGLAREDLFLTTKVWNSDQGYDETFAALEASLEKLGTEYVDLYLIHWAKPAQQKYVETWKALIELQKQGKVRSIGVSNFPQAQLEEIIEATGVTPVIHQIELHPYFQQRPLREFGEKHGILTEAWSPLGQGGDLLQDPVITQIAADRGATPAQVVLAWHLAISNVVIPKSVTAERIVANLEAAGVRLSSEEIARIDGLDRADGRIGPDPAECDF